MTGHTLRWAVIAVAAFAAGCGDKPQQAGDSQLVLIGQVSPLTGPQAHLGKDNENGARLALEEINAAGLMLGGKKVVLDMKSEDDAADPKTATTVAQKLVDEGVAGVIGHLNSGSTIPASKIYYDNGIPQISPSATAVAYTASGFNTAYRVMTNDAQQGSVLGNFAVTKLGAKKIAIIDDRTAYGQGLADVVEKVAKEKGIKVVAREFATDKTTDFNAILTKIRGSKPDVIMYGGMDATAGPMAKQMKQLGIKSVLLAGDGVCSPEFVKLAGDAAGIMHCSMAGEAVEKLAKGEEFKAKYKAEFNQDVQIYSPYSYDAVYVIVDAIKRAGKVDRAAITAAMPATNYPGLTGTIAFDEKGDIKNGAISMFKVAGDKLEYISTVR